MSEMGYISVVNWEKFQHYKDQTRPAWIKLYRDLLTDYNYMKLPDAARSHLVGLWLLAARYDNKIPADTAMLARLLTSTSKINLCILQEYGFISVTESLEPRPRESLALLEKIREDIDKKREDIPAQAQANGKDLRKWFDDVFWEAYPKKRSKGDALKAMLKLHPDVTLRERIILAVHEQAKSHDWRKENGKYIPYPGTWIRGERWDDETDADANGRSGFHTGTPDIEF